jgi:hypothetical protein
MCSQLESPWNQSETTATGSKPATAAAAAAAAPPPTLVGFAQHDNEVSWLLMPEVSLRSSSMRRGSNRGGMRSPTGRPRPEDGGGADSPAARANATMATSASLASTWPGGGDAADLASPHAASCPSLLPAAIEARLLDGDDDSVVSSVLDGQCDGSTVDQVAALRAVTTPHGTGATVYDPTDFEAIMAVLERGANPVGD